MNNNYNLNNKLALITGGSKGIGLATAIELLSNSAYVAICSRNVANLKSATKIINLHFKNPKFLAIRYDLQNDKKTHN